MKKRAGFTLMELLVAVGLMVVLMTAIVTIFYRTVDVMKISDARMNITENARIAVEAIGNDIQSAYPAIPRQTSSASDETGPQRMTFANFARAAEVVDGVSIPAGSNSDGACDYLGLVTLAPAPYGSGSLATRELKSVYMEYFLTTDDDAETSFTGTGYSTSLRSRRRFFVLKRRMWELPSSMTILSNAQAAGLPIFASSPSPFVVTSTLTPPGPVPSSMKLLEEADLCHWVVSFNIEVFGEDPKPAPGQPGWKWYELDDATTDYPYKTAVMPLGDGKPYQPQPCPPAMVVPPEPVMPRKFRISLRMIEGAGERQERLLQREICGP